MLFFKRKKTENGRNLPVKEGSEQKLKKKQKSPDMVKLFHESVVESVLSKCKENKSFITERDGKSLYAGILLRADNIGGISKKDKKDEAKGAIIEAANSGRIKVYATMPYLEQEKIVIIPDFDTVMAMDEFGLLVDAKYELVLIDSDGQIEETGISITYPEIQNIIDENMSDSIDDYLDKSDNKEDIPEDVPDDEPEDEPVVEPLDDETDEEYADEEYDERGDTGDFDVMDDLDSDEDEENSEENDSDESVSFEPENVDEYEDESNYGDEVDNEYGEDEYDEDDMEEVSAEDIQEKVRSIYFSEDLTFEIDADSVFDAKFNTGSPILFEVDRESDGFMNNVLNEQCQLANQALITIHNQHIAELRRLFNTEVDNVASVISKDFDLHNPDTAFGQQYQQLMRAKGEALNNLDNKVLSKEQEITTEYNKQREQYGDNAKTSAMSTFDERYGEQHRAEIANVKMKMQTDIEADFERVKKDLVGERNTQAINAFNLGIIEVGKRLQEKANEFAQQEEEMRRDYSTTLSNIVDDNRKEEIARTHALEEEQKRRDVVAELTNKHAAEIKKLNAVNDSNKQTFDSAVETLRKQFDGTTAAQEKAFETERGKLNSEIEDKQKQINNLVDALGKQGGEIREEYQSKINEMRQDKEATQDQLNVVVSEQKRSNKFATVAAIIGLFAFLAVGVLLGYWFGSENTNKIWRETPAVHTEVSVPDSTVNSIKEVTKTTATVTTQP